MCIIFYSGYDVVFSNKEIVLIVLALIVFYSKLHNFRWMRKMALILHSVLTN